MGAEHNSTPSFKPAPVSDVKTSEPYADVLARIWKMNRPEIDARLDAVDVAGVALLSGRLDAESQAGARTAAHKLAGSLGTFGMPEGSALAKELEAMLEVNAVLSVLRFAELAQQLRAIVKAGPVTPADTQAAPSVDPVPAEVLKVEEPLPAHSGEVDVLVVDDDAVLTELVRHALEMRGYSVTGIGDGKDAMEALLGPTPIIARLLLLDVDLPGINGYAMLRRLEADGITKRMPTIMLTARSSEKEVLEALRGGAIDHITKPFNISILVEHVRSALER